MNKFIILLLIFNTTVNAEPFCRKYVSNLIKSYTNGVLIDLPPLSYGKDALPYLLELENEGKSNIVIPGNPYFEGLNLCNKLTTLMPEVSVTNELNLIKSDAYVLAVVLGCLQCSLGIEMTDVEINGHRLMLNWLSREGLKNVIFNNRNDIIYGSKTYSLNDIYAKLSRSNVPDRPEKYSAYGILYGNITGELSSYFVSGLNSSINKDFLIVSVNALLLNNELGEIITLDTQDVVNSNKVYTGDVFVNTLLEHLSDDKKLYLLSRLITSITELVGSDKWKHVPNYYLSNEYDVLGSVDLEGSIIQLSEKEQQQLEYMVELANKLYYKFKLRL